MKVNKRLVEIYGSDFMDLIKRLRGMEKDVRHVLCKTHSRMLFPKSKVVVNLDDQISGRHDYLHKFKRSFFIIGNFMTIGQNRNRMVAFAPYLKTPLFYFADNKVK